MTLAGTVLHNSKNEWELLKSQKVEGLSPRSPNHRSGLPYTKEDGLFYGGLTFCGHFLLDGTGQGLWVLHYFHPQLPSPEGRGGMSRKN